MAALGLAVLLLAAIEGVLRLVGYGIDTRLVLPVDGSPKILNSRLNERVDHAWYGVTDLAGPEPRRFQRPRPAGTFRIVVVGASTVIGYPYPPELAFPRHLELLLERQAPDLDVEVLNAGVTAINSFAVRDVVAQAIACEPDLIIVHAGHNEFYGPGGVASTSVRLPRTLIPWLYTLRRQRLTQLCTDWAVSRRNTGQDLVASLPRVVEIPLDGDLMRAAERAYRSNLEKLVRTARAAGVPLLLTTVASNVRDQSPIRSLGPQGIPSEARRAWQRQLDAALAHMDEGRWSDALAAFRQADEHYDGYALAAYRTAQCLEWLGRDEEARMAYVRARDLDGCRFRAPGSFGRIVRDVAETSRETRFLDLAAAIDELAGPAGAGHDLFVEHVHYRFAGHHHLGRLLARYVQTHVLGRSWDESRVPDLDETEQSLGVLPQDHLVAYSFALQTLLTPPLNGAADASQHQQQLRAWIAGLYHALSPADQEMFADLSMQDMQADLPGALARRYAARGHDGAVEVLERGVVRQPWSADRHLQLAEALLRAGQTSRAAEALERAVELRPDGPAARVLRERLRDASANKNAR